MSARSRATPWWGPRKPPAPYVAPRPAPAAWPPLPPTEEVPIIDVGAHHATAWGLWNHVGDLADCIQSAKAAIRREADREANALYDRWTQRR